VVRSLRYVVTVAIASKSRKPLKIERDSDGQETLIRLISRLRAEHLDELKTQMDGDQSWIAFARRRE
jgi:hypothetical protein